MIADLDQFRDVALGCMVRHPTHQDVILFCQSDIQDACCHLGVFEEHFEKNSQPMREQNIVRESPPHGDILSRYRGMLLLGDHRPARLEVPRTRGDVKTAKLQTGLTLEGQGHGDVQIGSLGQSSEDAIEMGGCHAETMGDPLDDLHFAFIDCAVCRSDEVSRANCSFLALVV